MPRSQSRASSGSDHRTATVCPTATAYPAPVGSSPQNNTIATSSVRARLGDRERPPPGGACRHDGAVDMSVEAIIEEIIDPLMMGGLAEREPAMELRRLGPNAILVDFGEPDTVYVLTVEERRRT